MLGFLFTNVWMLAGLGALSVPILIHLLLKLRSKRIRFSTLQFFQKQDQQASRRRKLRNWFLLVLRLLIVALLVLAFARPFHQNHTPVGAAGRKRVVFVLDRSASLLATDSGGKRWPLAKDKIRRILSEMNPDDRAAMVSCATRTEVLTGFSPPAVVSKGLENLAPTYGTSNLGEGLRQAVNLVSSDLQHPVAIYVVSDFQRAACRNLSAIPVPDQIELKLVPIGDLLSPNCAITRLALESSGGTQPGVGVANFSEENASKITLEVAVDEALVSTAVLGLVAGGVTNVDLALPAWKPGWHNLQVSLREKDSLEEDNSRYACVFAPEPTRVLVVQPKNSRRLFEQESFFIAIALDPSEDSTSSVVSSFRTALVPPEDLAAKMAVGQAGSMHDLVVVPGLTDPPSGLGKTLTAFVEAGGGALFFLGEGTSANRYNSEFSGLLPAQPGAVEVSTDLGAGWRIGDFDTNTITFSSFTLPNSGDLHIPEFTKRYSLTLSQGSRRLASFDDGFPFIVTKPVGKGWVGLVNASADTSWSDWPKHKTFVPWLHGLSKQLARRTASESSLGVHYLTAGEEGDLELGPSASRTQFRLRRPDGSETVLNADEQGRLRDPGFSVPGVYALKDKSGRELNRIAVNLPAEESDLQSIRPVECLQQITRFHGNETQTLVAGLFGLNQSRKDFAGTLLLSALALLLLESLLSNRASA